MQRTATVNDPTAARNHEPRKSARCQPRIVVAGQVPPPMGGQNVMIARILAQFAAAPEFATEHLAFQFTPDFKTVRRGGFAKLFELGKVLARLAALRLRGPIDLLLYPAGGPQTVPIVRDLLLLPWVLLAAHRVAVQFHAAGAADRFAAKRGGLCRMLGLLYRRCFAAIVMTEFNRRDPEFFGMRRIAVVPHRLPDEFDAALAQPVSGRFLYLGHLCPDKGTPTLLRAFAQIAAHHPHATLELAGETLPPFSESALHQLIRELGLESRVILSGVLTGRAKLAAFGRAELFVFPSVAPYESFGLVLVEAMMWGLPIVATDWRGNRDVLGPDFAGLCYPPGPDPVAALSTALAAALGQPADRTKNRRLFLDRFHLETATDDYPALARRWLRADA